MPFKKVRDDGVILGTFGSFSSELGPYDLTCWEPITHARYNYWDSPPFDRKMSQCPPVPSNILNYVSIR